ncbi:translation initiation factor IF-2-like isoform X4 [Leopardus geoffroyi]|uniref:translation initiation factor IF-2-like isoform X4 n=1 Tax=Leopardus geoffroyi TaxID=46844 RepID=UPI001E262C72|nr:translation initiation factor IF-2-like isoform X4 [Leopardus geoffroyi]
MSRGHADALRAGAARASRAAAAPLRTPDSASRRRPPALLAASSGPPLSGGIPNAGGPRPAPRRGGSAPPRTGADPEAGRTQGLHGPRLSPASRKFSLQQDSQIPRESGAIPPPPTERRKVIHPSWRKLQKPVHTERTFRVQLPIDLSPGTDITCCTAFGKPCNISAPFPCLC